MTFCYSLVPSSPVHRDAFTCVRWKQTQRATARYSRKSERLEILSYKRDVPIISEPLKAQRSLW